MDLDFDRGTTKLADGPDGPVLVESNGYVLVALNIDTQAEARRLKALIREAGHHDVDYHLAPPSIP